MCAYPNHHPPQSDIGPFIGKPPPDIKGRIQTGPMGLAGDLSTLQEPAEYCFLVSATPVAVADTVMSESKP